MFTRTLALPKDPEKLRSVTARRLAGAKVQAILIESDERSCAAGSSRPVAGSTGRHQRAGHRAHRSGASSGTGEQLQLALAPREIAAAAMTARMKLPAVEGKDKPKRRPIPDHIPRWGWNGRPAPMPVPIAAGAFAGSGRMSPGNRSISPAASSVNRIVRPRLTCAWLANAASRPRCPRARSSGAGPGLLAHVLAGKDADHLPPIIFPCIARARSSTATGSTWTASA